MSTGRPTARPPQQAAARAGRATALEAATPAASRRGLLRAYGRAPTLQAEDRVCGCCFVHGCCAGSNAAEGVTVARCMRSCSGRCCCGRTAVLAQCCVAEVVLQTQCRMCVLARLWVYTKMTASSTGRPRFVPLHDQGAAAGSVAVRVGTACTTHSLCALAAGSAW